MHHISLQFVGLLYSVSCVSHCFLFQCDGGFCMLDFWCCLVGRFALCVSSNFGTLPLSCGREHPFKGERAVVISFGDFCVTTFVYSRAVAASASFVLFTVLKS